MDLGRPPRVLADRLQIPPDRPLGRHRVGLRQHRLELVGPVLRLDLPAPAEVELGLALVPDVVTPRRPGLPDVDDRLRQRRLVDRPHRAAHEQDVGVADPFVIVVDAHRLLPPRRVVDVERALDVGRRRAIVVGVRHPVHEHRRAGHVGEQDELVRAPHGTQERQRRVPLPLGHLMLLEHPVQRGHRVGDDCSEALAHRVYWYGLCRIRVSGISGCMPSTHLSPISRWANSTVSSIARRAASRSTSTSRPSRFTTRPLTITVWTSARCAWNATWPYGCSTGNMTGECSFLTSTTSAFLPSSKDPSLSSIPSAFEPPRVAQATTCSARRWWFVTVSAFACASRCSRERSAPSVERIAQNRSPLHHTLVSIDSDTGMSCLRSCHVGGYPWPALCSLSVETDTEPPVAAIRL